MSFDEETVPECLKGFMEMLCGCQSDETTWGVLQKELERCEAGCYESPDTLIMHVADHLGYTEHGTAIRGGWLTPLGKEALAALRAQPQEKD